MRGSWQFPFESRETAQTGAGSQEIIYSFSRVRYVIYALCVTRAFILNMLEHRQCAVR